MSIDIKGGKTLKDWNLWDQFVQEAYCCSFLNYSFWLDTYKKYFLKKKLFLFFEANQLIGGAAALTLSIPFFKVWIFPASPYLLPEHLGRYSSVLAGLVSIAKRESVTVLQQSIPYVPNRLDAAALEVIQSGKKGKIVKKISHVAGLGKIDLPLETTELLQSMSAKARRDIRASGRKGLTLRMAANIEDLSNIYQLFLQNALEQGYKIRNWKAYSRPWLQSIRSGQSYFLMADLDGQLKGAIWLIDAGKHFTYVMGGTLKEKPDLLVGYFLQWEAMKLSINKGYDFYNISLGGSKGVNNFKDKFGRQSVDYFGSFIWIFNHTKYSLFEKALIILQKRN